jgi:hypothetical protein
VRAHSWCKIGSDAPTEFHAPISIVWPDISRTSHQTYPYSKQKGAQIMRTYGYKVSYDEASICDVIAGLENEKRKRETGET